MYINTYVGWPTSIFVVGNCVKSIIDNVDSFHKNCYNLGCNGYAMKEINRFATMCEMGYQKDVIQKAILSVCTFEPVCGID